MSAPKLRTRLAAAAPTASEKDEEMKGKKGAEGQPTEDGEDEGEGDGKKKEVKEDGKDALVAPVQKTGISSERARMKAITTGAGAASFPSLAAHLAYDTDLTAEQAAAVFEAALADVDTSAAEPTPPAKDAGSPKGESFRKAMEGNAPNPQLGNGGGGKGEDEDPWIAAAKRQGLA